MLFRSSSPRKNSPNIVVNVVGPSSSSCGWWPGHWRRSWSWSWSYASKEENITNLGCAADTTDGPGSANTLNVATDTPSVETNANTTANVPESVRAHRRKTHLDKSDCFGNHTNAPSGHTNVLRMGYGGTTKTRGGNVADHWGTLRPGRWGIRAPGEAGHRGLRYLLRRQWSAIWGGPSRCTIIMKYKKKRIGYDTKMH